MASKFVKATSAAEERVPHAVTVFTKLGTEILLVKTLYSPTYICVGGSGEAKTLPEWMKDYTFGKKFYKGDRLEIEL